MEQHAHTTQFKNATIATLFNIIDESRYRIERTWKGLPVEQREFILAIADIDNQGSHLRDYDLNDRYKIAQAIKLIRKVSAAFPNNISLSEFNQFDDNLK